MRTLTLLSTLLLACAPPEAEGTDTGNAMTVQAGPVSQGRKATAPATIEAAWAGLADLRFEGCDEDDDRTDLEGPFVVDLTGLNPLGVARPTEQSLCALRLDLEPADDDGAGTPVEDDSLVLEGTRSDGVPFQIRSDRTLSVRIEDDQGALAGDDPERGLLLGFGVDAWLSGLDLDSAEPEDGWILIDEDTDDDRLDRFEDNVELTLALLRDDDQDGAPDR